LTINGDFMGAFCECRQCYVASCGIVALIIDAAPEPNSGAISIKDQGNIVRWVGFAVYWR
jgi:hypothetical protein